MNEALEKRLRAFAEGRGVFLTAAQIEQLVGLDGMVAGWKRAVDLSGFRDADERFRRYLGEPLDAGRWVPEKLEAALDIGSGGGSPALPLAIARPAVRWTLLEPNGRRAVFLEQAVRELAIGTARVVRSRWQDFVPERLFGLITSRGLALSEASVKRIALWMEPGGRLLLFTGQQRGRELVGYQGSLQCLARVRLAPGFKAWLVVFEKRPEKMPLSPGPGDEGEGAGESEA
jgi:16S rRNA (guanine527-N7)-methyltransferase